MNTAVLGEVVETATLPAEAVNSSRSAEELPLGTCIHGKYVVHGVLGHGGFAVVYDAEHLGLARRVAIKVLHLRVDTPLALVERFHREARVSALVRHPNVLEVYDTGALPDGSPFLVMERVDGETLSAAIARGRLSIGLVVELGCQLLRAIDAIAEAGIVHRDIKPDNVMLHMPNEGVPLVKLVDFGIAKQIALEASSRLTMVGALVGTPQYMSPEQIRGQDVDVRSDLYAVGAVLYEALTGKAPHESTNFSELVVAVLNNPIDRPSALRANCPEGLEEILLRALSRARERRYSSPREMLAALESHAVELGLPRGEEAFYTPDPAELINRPRQVTARDTLVRRLFPSSKVATRSLQLSAAALLLIGAPSLWQRVTGAESVDSGVVQSTAAALPAAAQAPDVRDLRPSAAPLLEGREEARDETRGEAQLAHPPVPVADASAPEVEPLAAVVVSGESGERTSAVEALGALAQQAAASHAARDSAAAVAAPVEPTAKAAASPSGTSAPAAVQSAIAATTPALDRTAARPPMPTPSAPSPASTSVRAEWQRTMQAALAELVRGKLADAQAKYREAVRLDPNEGTGFRGLGLTSARMGDLKSAREALNRYLELTPRAPDAAAIRERLSSLR